MLDFYGMPVFVNSFLEERYQFRFPRTKKKRIRKKWAKRAENYRRRPIKRIFNVAGSLYVHPAYLAELEAQGFTASWDKDEIHVRLTHPDVERRLKEKAEAATRRLVAETEKRLVGGMFNNNMPSLGDVNTDALLEAMRKVSSVSRERNIFELEMPVYAPPVEWEMEPRIWSKYELPLVIPNNTFLLTNCV